MKQNFPFFFSKEEPIKLSDAPEWYQNIGQRGDRIAERNYHAKVAGMNFPLEKETA